MTTIAIDHNTISADGLAVVNGKKVDPSFKKLIKRDGVIYAMAGRIEHCEILIDYLSNTSDELIPDIEGNVIAIENGEVRIYWVNDGVLDSDKVVPPYAIGSGGEYAYSALRMGMTSKQAVKHAGEIDINTNTKVTTMTWSK